jgi:isopentenyl-diphosphate delta-isomerase
MRDDQPLILVDERDSEVGTLGKDACHDGEGVLHRAFSVFLFDDRGRVVLQQRAQGKRLWPGFWSNSCCSHPRPGEATQAAAERRIVEELAVRAPLTFLYQFVYQARFGTAGSEHELCHVFAGRVHSPLSVNPDEVAAWRFVAPRQLSDELRLQPERFTPWLKLEWAAIERDHRQWLDAIR